MSWNGRERVRTKGSFAFGSSTPRDLSYMNKVPCKMRVYNAKAEPMEKRDETPLSEFVKMAHTNHIVDSSLSSGSKVAFGSGTPRQFLHLSQIPKSLRVYDARLLVSRPVTRSTTMPPKNRQLMGEQVEMDDVSSEPDLVTDRLELAPKRASTMGKMRHSNERRVSGVREETKELIEDRNIHRAKQNNHSGVEETGVCAIVPVQNDTIAVEEMIEDVEISREEEEIMEGNDQQ